MTCDRNITPKHDKPQAAPDAGKASEAGESAAGETTRKKRLAMVVLAVLLALALIAAVVFFLQGGAKILPDPNARSGSLKASSQTVEPNSYRLVLNQKPVVQEGSTECNIEFEVPSESSYSGRFDLVLDETGEVLASTGMVAPGSNLEKVQLARSLDPGEHKAWAMADVYSGVNKVNTISAEITIRVK